MEKWGDDEGWLRIGHGGWMEGWIDGGMDGEMEGGMVGETVEVMAGWGHKGGLGGGREKQIGR